MRIVLPGGSGQVGTVLARAFHRGGHDVAVLSRSPRPAPWRVTAWDPAAPGDPVREIDGADVVINLAGRSVDCRYSSANRREILESRVRSVQAVGRAIAQSARPPRVWLQAGTATIYAHTFGPAHDEHGLLGGTEPDAPAAWRFSIDVARAWERAFEEARTPGTRKVLLRSAMTMSPDAGGIFATLLRLVRLGLGGRAGSGRQFISWIHDRDFVRAIEFLVARDDLDGVVNVASPSPLPNAAFMAALRRAGGVPFGLPAPAPLLALGAMAIRTEPELILKSRRVVPGRLLREGFVFDFPDWPAAARDLCRRWRAGA
jgi:hypothetical protein